MIAVIHTLYKQMPNSFKSADNVLDQFKRLKCSSTRSGNIRYKTEIKQFYFIRAYIRNETEIQVRPSSGKAVYPHMTFYVHTPRDIDRHAITEAIPTLNFTSGWVADSSDFGLLGSRVPQNWRFPAQDADEFTVQNLTPLALSSPEKSVTVQTKLQTYPHLAYRHVWTKILKQFQSCFRLIIIFNIMFKISMRQTCFSQARCVAWAGAWSPAVTATTAAAIMIRDFVQFIVLRVFV